MKKTINYILMVILIMLISFSVILGDGKSSGPKSGEQINWQVISSGGQINGSSTNFLLSNTVSQTAVSYGTSTNFVLKHGFWQDLGGGSSNCCDVPGDANDDGTVNILDITYLINYLYMYGWPPPCMYEGDANGNCSINILDITYLIAFLYQGGPAPVCAASCPGW